MDIKSINLSLFVGPVIPDPAPKFIAEALQSVTITRSDTTPQTFQMEFHADRAKGMSTDYLLLDSPLLRATNRVILMVTVNGVPNLLMDGIITTHSMNHDSKTGVTTLTVSGEDVSALMNLYEFSLEYPGMPDDVIALVILGKYAVVGVIPVIIPTPTGLLYMPIESVPQQNSTDRNHLQQLASNHGYRFYVQAGPAFGVNTVYFGPPIRIGVPQKALTVNMGPETNVENIRCEYNALAPTLVVGEVQDRILEADLPVVTLTSLRLPPLASQPALDATFPLTRIQLYQCQGQDAMWAYATAQNTTDQSTDQVVTVQGTLDTLRYGAVLNAPGIVGLRGLGYSYDGNYYVQSVTHTMSRTGYKQQFTLNREGLGSLTSNVTP